MEIGMLAIGLAVFTGIGAGIGIGIATGKASEARPTAAMPGEPEAAGKINSALLLAAPWPKAPPSSASSPRC